jgi:hypothetical protein
MAAPASSGTNQQLTLDDPSFEKLLAAAWVLQCLHDQLHNPQVFDGETIAEPAKAPKRTEPVTSDLAEVTKPVVQAIETSPRITEAESKPEVVSVRSADDELLAELVEAQQAIETGALDLDAAMRRAVAVSLRFTGAEGAAIWLFAKDEFTYRASAGTASDDEKLRLAVLSSLAGAWPGSRKPGQGEANASKQSWVGDFGAGTTSLLVAPIYHGLEVAGALAAFTKRPDAFSGHNATTARLLSGLLSHALRKTAEVEIKAAEMRAVELKVAVHADRAPLTKPLPAVVEKPADLKQPARREPAFNLRTAFNRVVVAFRHYRPSFRVNFPLRALRAIAIATPVWLLALIAALLLLEAWRHQPFQSAQAISTPSPSTAEASVNTNLPSRTTSTSALSENTKKPASVEPKGPTPTPSFTATHEQITDPATSSVVQQLSRYEINGLRRQAMYGDDSAAFTLGMAYEIGRYVHQNCAEAARWVRTAAEAGNAAAQYNLGLRYQTGDGLAVDRTEAETWLRKAAHRNREAKLALRMLASR